MIALAVADDHVSSRKLVPQCHIYELKYQKFLARSQLFWFTGAGFSLPCSRNLAWSRNIGKMIGVGMSEVERELNPPESPSRNAHGQLGKAHELIAKLIVDLLSHPREWRRICREFRDGIRVNLGVSGRIVTLSEMVSETLSTPSHSLGVSIAGQSEDLPGSLLGGETQGENQSVSLAGRQLDNVDSRELGTENAEATIGGEAGGALLREEQHEYLSKMAERIEVERKGVALQIAGVRRISRVILTQRLIAGSAALVLVIVGIPLVLVSYTTIGLATALIALLPGSGTLVLARLAKELADREERLLSAQLAHETSLRSIELMRLADDPQERASLIREYVQYARQIGNSDPRRDEGA
ncbi:hypothetical protein ACRJ4B_24495 [Streptomyces sp. GTA36]